MNGNTISLPSTVSTLLSSASVDVANISVNPLPPFSIPAR
jgi:hypothetical protein